MKPFDPQLAPGDCLAFSLRANPVIRRRDESGKQSRHDIVMDAKHQQRSTGIQGPQQMLVHEAGREWILARQEALGVRIDDTSLQVDGYQVRQFEKGGERGAIHLATVEFAGRLLARKAGEGHTTGLGAGRGAVPGLGGVVTRC